MHVTPGVIEDSPSTPGFVRSAARVSYSGSSVQPEEYWYELPAAYASDLALNGNPWLAALLPLAASLGEPIEWELPVDRPLVEGAREILRVWHSWYGNTAVVPLRGPVVEVPPRALADRAAAFLSCGVDSFFTALDHGNGEARDERGSIDEFLFVEGFDLGLAETEVCERRRRFIEEAAAELNTPLVVVRTNLLETLWGKRVNWDLWGHGAALASVALALEGRYRQVLIPASNMYLHLVPWGSHPLTDALFSSWSVRVRDDGAAHDRADKVRAIATSAIALRHLRVCYQLACQGRNCGHCAKCLLTMLMLDTMVGLSSCPTFPSSLDLAQVRALEVQTSWDRRHLRRLRDHATPADRQDVVKTIDRLLRNPTLPRRLFRAARRIARQALAERMAGLRAAAAQGRPRV